MAETFQVYFNGEELNSVCRITEVDRELLPPHAVDSYKIDRRNGEFFDGESYGARRIKISFTIHNEKLQDARQVLAYMLDTREPKEIILGDEPDRYYLGIVEGASNFDEILDVLANGTFTFLCLDPFAYAIWESTVEVPRGTHRFSFQNEGSAPTLPRFEFDFMSDCGFVAVASPNGIIQVGNHKEQDLEAIPPSEKVMAEEMDNISGWRTDIPCELDNFSPTGKFGTNKWGVTNPNQGSSSSTSATIIPAKNGRFEYRLSDGVTCLIALYSISDGQIKVSIGLYRNSTRRGAYNLYPAGHNYSPRLNLRLNGTSHSKSVPFDLRNMRVNSVQWLANFSANSSGNIDLTIDFDPKHPTINRFVKTERGSVQGASASDGSWTQSRPWHGAVITKAFKKAGTRMSAYSRCQLSHEAKGWDETGIQQHYLLDNNQKAIMSIKIIDASTNYRSINVECWIHYPNGSARRYSRDSFFDFKGTINMWKMGAELIWQIHNERSNETLYYKTTLPSFLARVVSYYQIAAGKLRDTNSYRYNDIMGVYADYHNTDKWKDIPNEFSLGERLVIDNQTGDVTLSGLPHYGSLDIGSRFFEIPAGKTDLQFGYSGWARDPFIRIKYRKRWL